MGHAVTIERQGRHWAVRDDDGTLVVLAVYRKGAIEGRQASG